MSMYKVSRGPTHPVEVVEELLDACDGVKDYLVEQDAQLSSGVISKLRMVRVPNPGILTIAKLAGALGYRLRLEKVE